MLKANSNVYHILIKERLREEYEKIEVNND
jgi:hypothetical protein